MTEAVHLEGLIPPALMPRTRKIVIEDYALKIDIGFQDFEVGKPQRVLVSVEVWVDATSFASEDEAASAWDYDILRTEIAGLAGARRFNLQETLARGIYDLIAARRGVTALRVSVRKPDVYEDCARVGVELASF